MNEKILLRREMKEILSRLNIETYRENSLNIQDRLFSSDDWKNANTIGVTISRFPEVDTKRIIEKSWEMGKKIAVPKCHSKNREMQFYYLESFSQLETVYFGLHEPIVSEVKPCQKKEIELMLVPGLVYDYKGYRIGFGGGYYDRYLLDFIGVKIALAFDKQVVKRITKDEYDVPVHKIITNEGMYDCTAGE
ncbi:5-formyltetrahydrofolate cyclo-ligase [Sutcliffiella rhizosphaerae]|uniref:5-formyltetrahydrofolate cyclo-ligase n=1 Tax=Sutcliffiella rhizosphaerae TaxID=2880967 RepID=A0ABM8YHD7_9BACI|nr:5-formyltetrahydrofolate cyclo-ligase [Sutcliffiella rhizosphaerae]CAG9619305.1 putative protein YqgN [Sutcliffiella rhizosphaerae]